MERGRGRDSERWGGRGREKEREWRETVGQVDKGGGRERLTNGELLDTVCNKVDKLGQPAWSVCRVLRDCACYHR